VIDEDYVQETYEGKKNNRLEDIPFVEEKGEEKEKKEDGIKEEEIIPLIIQD